METIVFCIPLKPGCLEQYREFVKKKLAQKEAYKDMLTRYDIHCAKIWHRNTNGRDYIFVYHEVGPQFEEKMQGWTHSQHPYDQWFNAEIMKVYDLKDASEMAALNQLVDFKA